MSAKPFHIPKQQVMQAYRLVKANAGAAGVDKQSLADFEEDLKNNLYRLWNRLSSGSYFPPAVKGVLIPKKTAGEFRLLGVPTVADRIAQMVVKLQIEPNIEPHFLDDSYGYRPNKSALDAIGVTRERCWNYDWVLEFDIKGLFDNIPHDLLLKAVYKHVQCPWALLYLERWLNAPTLMPNGEVVARDRGCPQGGVVSPILSNLFLHYVFDTWMVRSHPQTPWCRYADDGLTHCQSYESAKDMLRVLTQRFEQCGLELHPAKTQIVYCKDANRKGQYPVRSFDFLGYTFRPRSTRNRNGQLFLSFSPALSRSALKSMASSLRKSQLRNWTHCSIEDIGKRLNPVLRGWINYYGRYRPSALHALFRLFNRALVSWVMAKYRRFRNKKTRAGQYLARIAEARPELFAHWHMGIRGAFV